MRIDHDYVRQLLLEAEDQTDGKINFEYVSPVEGMSPEEFERQSYHLSYMVKAGLLEGDNVAYWDLTPLGHEYLDSIRDDTVWKKFLGVAGRLGSLTASQLIDKVIEFGLNKFLP